MTARTFLHGLGVLLGFLFVFIGGGKINGIPATVAPLAGIGIGEPLVVLVGWGEVAVGLLLVHPKAHRVAGMVLALWLMGAIGVHARAGDLVGTLVPGALGVFGLLLAFRSAAVDWSEVGPAPLAKLPEPLSQRIRFVLRQTALGFFFRWAVGGIAFWASLPLLALSHARLTGEGQGRGRLELLSLYLLFYGYGVGGIWSFVGHFFMSDTVAASVGWAAGSPFQKELAFYALGTGTVGLLTPWIRNHFWLAAALTPSIFGYGAALTHVKEYLTTGNDAPMNWGFGPVVANITIPTVVLVTVWLYLRSGGTPTTRTRGVASAL